MHRRDSTVRAFPEPPAWELSGVVLLAGLDVDHVARADLSDGAAAARHQSDAVSDVEGPTLGVVAPRSRPRSVPAWWRPIRMICPAPRRLAESTGEQPEVGPTLILLLSGREGTCRYAGSPGALVSKRVTCPANQTSGSAAIRLWFTFTV